MNNLLCIVGPTGTGKTAQALVEASKSPSIIVSADSRQVYRGMDIVTGKDHPKGVTIYGIDIVSPDEPCSVAVWYDAVMPHMSKAWREGKQVIVVGGTGLYVKAITDGIATMQVPINQSLRDELNRHSVSELQQRLIKLDKSKFDSMNQSDVSNPRRLLRAIEIAQSVSNLKQVTLYHQAKMIGLRYYHNSNYSSKIRQRVLARIKCGAVVETQALLVRYGKNIQSMSAIGYASITNFLEKQLTHEEMVADWVRRELQYAKRQMTWFNKQSVIWYDIDTKG